MNRIKPNHYESNQISLNQIKSVWIKPNHFETNWIIFNQIIFNQFFVFLVATYCGYHKNCGYYRNWSFGSNMYGTISRSLGSNFFRSCFCKIHYDKNIIKWTTLVFKKNVCFVYKLHRVFFAKKSKQVHHEMIVNFMQHQPDSTILFWILIWIYINRADGKWEKLILLHLVITFS